MTDLPDCSTTTPTKKPRRQRRRRSSGHDDLLRLRRELIHASRSVAQEEHRQGFRSWESTYWYGRKIENPFEKIRGFLLQAQDALADCFQQKCEVEERLAEPQPQQAARPVLLMPARAGQ